MRLQLARHRTIWLVGGALAGLLAGGLLPTTPLHAVATHGEEGFSICTCMTTERNVEAICFLDALTGDLKGAVLGPNGKFFASYETNVVKDFGADAAKAGKYLMVSGTVSISSVPGVPKISGCAIYVLEVSSGSIAAYGLPQPKGPKNQFVLLDVAKLRTVAVRGGAAAGGAGGR